MALHERTVYAFYDLLANYSSLGKIESLFESEKVFVPEDYKSRFSGQRRSRADSYVSSLNLQEAGDIRKLLNVFELFFLETKENEYLTEDRNWKQFINLLERDGYTLLNGKLIEMEDLSIHSEIAEYTEKYEITHVQRDWERALEQAKTDPEDSITATRSMLESTLKWILDDIGEGYKETESLNQLYKKTANLLKLSPEQHDEEVFKQILGSTNGVIKGLGALRNTYGDSHGKGKVYYKPSERHAKFAINLSGATCVYLIETYLANNYK